MVVQLMVHGCETMERDNNQGMVSLISDKTGNEYCLSLMPSCLKPGQQHPGLYCSLRCRAVRFATTTTAMSQCHRYTLRLLLLLAIADGALRRTPPSTVRAYVLIPEQLTL